MKRRIFSAVVAAGIGVALLSTAVTSPRAEDIWALIVGARTGWWAGGDTLLFEGDGQVGSLGCTVECIGWCRIDNCFAFRRVSGVDLQACSWTNTSASHCARVDGCFWMGLDETYSQDCWWCDDNHNFCGSLWEVVGFGGIPPGEGEDDGPTKKFVCWTVELLCAPEEPTDCNADGPEDWCDE